MAWAGRGCRAGLVHRRARLELRCAHASVRRAERPPVRHGLGWLHHLCMLCRADHDGPCIAWTVRRRPLCRRRRRSAGGLDIAFHRLAGADDSRAGVVRACGSGDGRGVPRAIFPAEDLEYRLLSFQGVMRRCLEHAGARHRDGDRVHAAGPCLCPDRDPHRLPFQASCSGFSRSCRSLRRRS